MINAGHGRAWISRLQRYQKECVPSLSALVRWGRPKRSMLRPVKPRKAGSSVIAASIVISHGRDGGDGDAAHEVEVHQEDAEQ